MTKKSRWARWVAEESARPSLPLPWAMHQGRVRKRGALPPS